MNVVCNKNGHSPKNYRGVIKCTRCNGVLYGLGLKYKINTSVLPKNDLIGQWCDFIAGKVGPAYPHELNLKARDILEACMPKDI